MMIGAGDGQRQTTEPDTKFASPVTGRPTTVPFSFGHDTPTRTCCNFVSLTLMWPCIRQPKQKQVAGDQTPPVRTCRPVSRLLDWLDCAANV
jgi:hypothetical protein